MNSNKIALLPEYLLYLLILLLPFEELNTFGGLTITKLIGLAFFICSMVDPKRFYGSIPSAFIVFALYISIGMIIDIFSFPLEIASFNALVRPLLMCVLMITTYNLSINRKFGHLVMAICLSSLIYGIAQLFELGGAATRIEGTVIDGVSADRIAVLGGDENFAACFISLSVLAGIVYGFNLRPSRWRYRLPALATSGIGFCALLKTGSRGGMLALFVGIAAIVLTVAKGTQRLQYALVVALLLGLLSVGAMQSPAFKARIISSVETGETAGRTDIWTESVRLFVDSPIYGFGYRMHQFKLGERTGHEQRGTHNLFLSVLLGSGLLGLSLFLYFYCQSFKAIWLHKAEGINAIVFVWFFMALAASLSINTEIAKWFWLLVALAFSAGKSRPAASIWKNRQPDHRGANWREPIASFSGPPFVARVCLEPEQTK